MFSQRSDITPPLPIYTGFVEVGAFEMRVSVRHPMRRELSMEDVGLIYWLVSQSQGLELD